MYVCICHGITEKEIVDAARNGVDNLDQLKTSTGCATGCGSCVNHALTVLLENQKSTTPAFLTIQQQLGLVSNNS